MQMFYLLLLVLTQQTAAVLYRLNASDHIRMPPVYHLDPYERCLYRPGGVYCDVELTVVSDEPNELYNMITEYSEHTPTHFNHTNLKYGICVTKTCEKFYMENATDLKLTLEACLNESLWNTYRLKSIVSDKMSCDRYGDITPIDKGDIVVAVMVLVLLMLNLTGSFYGFYSKNNKNDNKFLLCFSISHNWNKLVAPPVDGPGLAELRGLTGMKTLTMMLVILSHSFLPSVVTAENELYLEQMYDNLFFQTLFNGTLVMQTFIIISGFLMTLKYLKHFDNHKITWSVLPQGIVSRWLRLTPIYAVVLAITSTWVRFLGSGPLWSRIVEVEVQDCRREWWYNLLYINNYIDNSQCMPQTWYLAADMQLHILGLIVLTCFTSSKARKIVLGILVVLGLVIPVVQIFVQDLNAVLIVSPGVMTGFFVTDPTFNNLYKRGHTNIINFVFGMGTGWLIYYCQKNELKTNKYKKYRYLVWSVCPAMLGTILLGSIFYMDRPQFPFYFRAIYAALAKPFFGLLLVLLIIGLTFKVEDFYRGILEWSGWTTLGRLSYCAYCLHVLPIRTACGLRSTLTHISLIKIACDAFGNICLTLMLSLPFWLLVEKPLSQMTNLLMPPLHSEKNKDTSENKIDSAYENSTISQTYSSKYIVTTPYSP